MPDKPKKRKFAKLGYGALALYASGLGAVALALYGINVSNIMMEQNRSERVREQVRTGRMLVGTEDRTQCRSLRFDNDTAELSHETLVECDRSATAGSGGGSFDALRNGFMKR
jgi:hypothetical protein